MKTNVGNLFQEIMKHSAVGLLVVIVIVFSLLSPQFLTFQNLVNLLIQVSALAIIATGMTFVLLTAGIDLSVGATMFLAGAVAGKMAVAGAPLGLAVLVVGAIGIAFGWVNALFIARFRIIAFVVTLATLYVGRGAGLLISETRAINLPESFLRIGSARVLGIPFPILVLGIVVGAAHLLLTATKFGRQVYALGNSLEKSEKAGLPVNRILVAVYLICGFCAALGGLVALTQLGAVSPTFGLQSEFTAIAAAVLGGTSLFGGKGQVLPGTLLGAFTIQTIQSGLVMVNADPYVYPLITGGVIFLIVLIDSYQHRQQVKARRLSGLA